MKKFAFVALTLVAIAAAACGGDSGDVAIVDPTPILSDSEVAQSQETQGTEESTSQATTEVETSKEIVSDAITEAPSGGVFR